MTEGNDKIQSSNENIIPCNGEAIRHLREAIANGKHWYIALLEAMRLWAKVEEN